MKKRAIKSVVITLFTSFVLIVVPYLQSQMSLEAQLRILEATLPVGVVLALILFGVCVYRLLKIVGE